MKPNRIESFDMKRVGDQPVENWVREVLEPDQLSTAKLGYGRCSLNPATLILLWGLRVYVVLMVFIIAVEIHNALQTS